MLSLNDRLLLALLSVLVSVAFVVPYHQPPLPTFHSEFFAFCIAVLVGAVLLCRRRYVAVPPLLTSVGLLSAVLVARSTLLLYQQPAALAVGYLLAASVVFFAVRTLVEDSVLLHYVRQRTIVRVLLVAVAVGGWLAALSGFLEAHHIGLHAQRSAGSGIVGALGQQNTLSAYIACGLAALLVLPQMSAAVRLLIAMPMVMALSLTSSTGAWVYMLLLIAACRDVQVLRRVWVPCLLLFVMMKLLPGAPASAALSFVERSSAPRLSYIATAWRIWLDFPIFGAGVGEFAFQSFMHAQPGDAALERHAHNLVMQLLAEGGVVALLLVLLIAVQWYASIDWSEVPALRPSIASACLRKIEEYRALYVVLGIIGCFSLTEFPLWHAQFLFLCVIAMALLPHHERTEARSYGVMFQLAFCCCIGVLMLVMVWRDYERFEAFCCRSSAGSLQVAGAFRPQIELMIASSGMIERSPRTAQAERALIERAMHAFPKEELLCRYVSLLYASGDATQADSVLYRITYLYPSARCLIPK